MYTPHNALLTTVIKAASCSSPWASVAAASAGQSAHGWEGATGKLIRSRWRRLWKREEARGLRSPEPDPKSRRARREKGNVTVDDAVLDDFFFPPFLFPPAIFVEIALQS